MALAGAALALATGFFTLVTTDALAFGTAAGLEVVGRVVLLLVDALGFVAVALLGVSFVVPDLVVGLAGALAFTISLALELGLFYHRASQKDERKARSRK